MKLSPTARTVLTIIASAVAAVGALLASGSLADVPEWVGVVVTVLGTIFAGLGIVPSQVGGTQKGLVSPSVVDVPPSEKIMARDSEVGFAAVELCAVVSAVCLVILVVIAID